MCKDINVITPATTPVSAPPNGDNVPSTAIGAALTRVNNVPQEAGRGEQMPPTPASPSLARPDSLQSDLLNRINQMNASQDAKKRTAMCEALKTSGIEDVHIKAAYDEVVKLQPTSDKTPCNSFTEEVENAYLAATQESLSVKSPEVIKLAQRVMVLFNSGEIDQAQRDKVFSKLKDVKLGDSAKKAEKMAASVVEAIEKVTANDVNTAICTGLVAIMKQKGVARVDEKSLTIGLDYFNRLLHKLDSSLQGDNREMAMNTALDALRYFMLPPAAPGVDTPDTRPEQPTTSATLPSPVKEADPSPVPDLSQDEDETLSPHAANPSGPFSAPPPMADKVSPDSDTTDTAGTEPRESRPWSLPGTRDPRALAQAQATSGQEAAAAPDKGVNIKIINSPNISQNLTPAAAGDLAVSERFASLFEKFLQRGQTAPPAPLAGGAQGVQTAQPALHAEVAQRGQTAQPAELAHHAPGGEITKSVPLGQAAQEFQTAQPAPLARAAERVQTAQLAPLARAVQQGQTAQPAPTVQAVQRGQIPQRDQATQRKMYLAISGAGKPSSLAASSQPAVTAEWAADPRASFKERLAFFEKLKDAETPPIRTSNAFKHGIVSSDNYITATSGIQGREIARLRQKSL